MDHQNVFESFVAASNSTQDLFVCRACLATDIKLFDIHECDLAESFEAVIGLPVPPDDGLPQHLCPYCFALLQKFGMFKEKCQRSLEILETVARLTRPLTTDYIRIIDRNAEGLSLPFSVHQKKIEIVCPKPPIADKLIKPGPSFDERRVDEIHKDNKTQPEEVIRSYPAHKEVPIDTEAFEDNPFAVPGTKVFRSAAVVLRAAARSAARGAALGAALADSTEDLVPPPPLHIPPRAPKLPRKRRRPGDPLAQPVQRNRSGPLESVPEGYPGCGAALRYALRLRGTSLPSVALMLSSLTTSTLYTYNAIYKQWWRFCARHQMDPYRPPQSGVLMFFTEKFERGLSVVSGRLHRGALALLLGKDINKDAELHRLFRGVATTDPGPKYFSTWDPTIVLDLLSDWYPNNELPLDKISKKLVTLLALCTGHANGSMARLKLTDLSVERDGVKLCAPSRKRLVYWLPYYEEDPRICPVRCLLDYLRKSEALRAADCPNVLINVKRPYGRASGQTVTRWIYRTLVMCRQDMSVFEAPGGREALSQYKSEFISLDVMRRQARCTGRAAHFLQNYKTNDDPGNVGR